MSSHIKVSHFSISKFQFWDQRDIHLMILILAFDANSEWLQSLASELHTSKNEWSTSFKGKSDPHKMPDMPVCSLYKKWSHWK